MCKLQTHTIVERIFIQNEILRSQTRYGLPLKWRNHFRALLDHFASPHPTSEVFYRPPKKQKWKEALLTYLKIVVDAEVEGLVVGAGFSSEDRGPDRLQGGPVSGDEVEVIAEERRHAEGEHRAHEEEKYDVEPG